MKSKVIDWLKVILLLTDEMAVLAAVFLVLHFLGVDIPLPLMVGLGLVVAVFVFIIHIKVIPTFHLRRTTGQEGMIGKHGMVVAPLSPKGLVHIADEDWKARTDGDYIDAGEEVEVTEMNGLLLTVIRPREV
jgi:membrane protein implicated in regulation of membrane protease activity